MTVTYYVALPFVRTEEGVAARRRDANETAAIQRAEKAIAGALKGPASEAATRTWEISKNADYFENVR